MTDNQRENYNRMLNALRTISQGFMTSDDLQQDGDCGLDGSEALGMAYDSIQAIARSGCEGIEEIKNGG